MAERAASVSTKDFIKGYLPLQKAGKTREEIAEALNMKPGSFNTKLSTLAGELMASTTVFIVPGETDEDESVQWKGGDYHAAGHVDTLRKLRQAIDRDDFEIVKEGVQLPMPAGSRAKRNLSDLGDLAAQLMGGEDESTDTDETDES